MKEDLFKELVESLEEALNMIKEEKQICLHDECTECNGTGRKKDGTICLHFISCPCPKCTPRF